MIELAAAWYSTLGSLQRSFAEPLRDLALTTTIGPLAALVLGGLGALAPCQISTSVGAVALIGRRPDARALLNGLFYVAGKATTYVILGLIFVLVGRAADASTIPAIQAIRKLLGPAMLLAGLALIGVIRPRGLPAIGSRIALIASDRVDPTRPLGAYGLGLAFGLAFCPTLFLLFFGLLIPLALASPAGAAYPALFALGTAVPVLVALVLLWAGIGGGTPSARAQRVLTRVAGVIAVLVGLNDTLLYWAL